MPTLQNPRHERFVQELATGKSADAAKRSDRPELEKALKACRKHKAKLVIAKLDRLSRNVHFISGLMERKVDFVACNMPSANAFMINVYAAVAQEERRMISDRTKAGLAAAKARGVKLGGPRLPAINETRQAAALERARAIAPILSELAGMSARSVAAELNARQVETPSGAPWSAKTVIRVRERLAV
jgi:DNA invertase Pin-like site-specific DNA recombinase